MFYDDINKVIEDINVAIKNGKNYCKRIWNRKCRNIS